MDNLRSLYFMHKIDAKECLSAESTSKGLVVQAYTHIFIFFPTHTPRHFFLLFPFSTHAMADVRVPVSYYENFLESLARIVSKLLTDRETEAVLSSIRSFQDKLHRMSRYPMLYCFFIALLFDRGIVVRTS